MKEKERIGKKSSDLDDNNHSRAEIRRNLISLCQTKHFFAHNLVAQNRNWCNHQLLLRQPFRFDTKTNHQGDKITKDYDTFEAATKIKARIKTIKALQWKIIRKIIIA